MSDNWHPPTRRWTRLRYHEGQARLLASRARFITAFCGRRSGKTELLGKRKPLIRIFEELNPEGWYVFGEPIRDQAKRIMWADLKKMVPRSLIADVSESTLTMKLVWGAELTCMGMDAPERVEGRPISGIVLDEYASMKETVWTDHVRPGLDTPGLPPGWAFFPGTPEGRNHAYRLHRAAIQDTSGDWDSFHWPSADIMAPDVIEALRRDLDERTFRQECEGSFEDFAGRAYHAFDRRTHVASERIAYRSAHPLLLFFDFNVSPGTATVAQEIPDEVAEFPVDRVGFHAQGIANPLANREVKVGKKSSKTCILDEVHISDNSNTPLVCQKIIERWKHHDGRVICYGDPAGGARGTAQTEGSDWDLIRKYLRPHFPRLSFRVASSDPGIRPRLNAVNSRLRSADNSVGMLISPNCVKTIEDFEGVVLNDRDEIDKKADPDLSHLSDGIAYYCAYEFPVKDRVSYISEMFS